MHRLRGEFAFVLWDERNRTMFAARDRFGIKPLFYAWHDGALYLASEVKALFAAGVPARWDAERFRTSVEYGGPSDAHAVRRRASGAAGPLPDCHRRHVQVHQYWDFNYPRGSGCPSAPLRMSTSRSFAHALEEAVRLRLRADVPVGCYLSGGLDSCAVLGLAARHHPDPIRAFTLTFDRPDYDEEARSARDGDARRRRVPSHPDRPGRSRAIISPTRCIRPRRSASTRTASRNTC